MGRLATLLSFARRIRNNANVTDVKVNHGSSSNVTGEHFSDSGDDSHPLVDDYVALNTASGAGREIITGYLDPVNTPKSRPGEKRIYGRDTNGTSVNEVWLQNDGSIIIKNDIATVTIAPTGAIAGVNDSGTFELQVGGTFVVNGMVTIDTSGNINTPGTITGANIVGTSVVAAGKELAAHVHPAGTPPANTGPNV
jgi:hypothetical protein